MDNFKWDDSTVLEFVHYTLIEAPAFSGRYADLERFKKSKQPPKSEKPLLGIRPQYKWAEDRVKELTIGIEGYSVANRHSDTPPEWYEELAVLDEYLQSRKPQPPQKESNVTDQITAFKRIADNSIWMFIDGVWKSEGYVGVYGKLLPYPDKDFIIWAVKNSSGVEFTIGDEVEEYVNYDFRYQIDEFKIKGEDILAYQRGGGYNIDNLRKKFKSIIPPLSEMQPTNQLRWARVTPNGFVVINDGSRSMFHSLEQLWKNTTTGKEEWRAVEVVK